MPNYQTSLKVWGASGEEPPDNYSYEEGEQPIDDWDNWFNSNVVSDIDHLIKLTNSQLDSSYGTSEPGSPEDGELFYSANSGALRWWNATGSVWEEVMPRSGGDLDGDLQMSDNSLTSLSGVHVQGAPLDYDWHSKQEGGTVDDGTLVPVGTFGLDDGEELYVTQAMLMRDGISQPCVNNVDLIITDGSSNLQTILNGDGSTVYDDETGDPVASYTNTSGGHETVAIALDNGHINQGYGQAVSAYGGFIARTE
jgi:hypothetical protein